VIVVLVDEQIVVFLDEHVLATCQFGSLDLFHYLVVYFGTLVDQFEFGLVAVSHAPIELSLEEEGNDEPVDTDETIGRTLVEEQHKSSYDCDGGLEDHVHVLEQIEYQPQIDIFQLVNLRLRDTV